MARALARRALWVAGGHRGIGGRGRVCSVYYKLGGAMRIQVTLTADIETDVSPSEVAYAFDRNAHQIPFQMLMTFCEVRGKYLVETASERLRSGAAPSYFGEGCGRSHD